jgi:hypothetical protein
MKTKPIVAADVQELLKAPEKSSFFTIIYFFAY